MNSLPHITKGRSEYVPYDLAPGRVDAIWNRLRASQQGLDSSLEARATWMPTRRQWSMAGGAVAMVACTLLLLDLRGEQDPSAWSGARLQAGNEALRVALQDGSEIEAQPHASIELLSGTAREVRLSLRSGAGRFRVAKNRDRRFIVEAGSVQVRVVGTRFEVSRNDRAQTVGVEVEEGIVEVTPGDGGKPLRLRAGESIQLTQRPRPPHMHNAPADASLPTPADPTAATTTEVESIEITEAELALASDKPAAQRTARRLWRRHPRPHAALAQKPEAAEPAPAAPQPTVPGARELLEEAQRAQAAGERRVAAELYEQIMQLHPHDARASLAAFELGRVRMDYLGDAKGAIAALRWSLRTTTSAFREDAMARLVRSAETVDQQTCKQHKQAYLAEYPRGRYAEDIERRCDGR